MKILLVSMPFAALHRPSIALTQLRSVLLQESVLSPGLAGRQEFGDQIEVTIKYLNHDFGVYFGRDVYDWICGSFDASVTGLGDWLFRRAAFPDASDNQASYLTRYGRQFSRADLLARVAELRDGLEPFLERLIDENDLDSYDLAGFTSMFAQNVPSFALARKLKERNGKIVTVMGGANCETVMGAALARRASMMDFIFSGPALRSFPAVVRALLDGAPERCHSIPGVFSAQSIALKPAGGRNEIGAELDIDADVPLDYDDFLASLADKCPTVEPILLFETSRGCWWGEKAHCTFCGLNGTTMGYRAMSPDRALDLLGRLFEYAPRVRQFHSVDNILPTEYVRDLFPRLHPPEGVELFWEVKANLSDEDLRVLALASVTEVQPGIEALATSTLRLMKKGTSAFQNLAFLKNCLANRVRPTWNLLIGFPGEAEEVYRKYVEDIPHLVHLPPPTGAYPVRFDRFSPYHRQAAEYGLRLKPYDFYDMIYPFPEEELAELAYYFVDVEYRNEYIGAVARWIRPLRNALAHWNARWNREDNGLAPSLRLEGDAERGNVVDTRTGQRIDHAVAADEIRLLGHLAKRPLHADPSAAEALGFQDGRLMQLIELFHSRGWLFREESRYVSLLA